MTPPHRAAALAVLGSMVLASGVGGQTPEGVLPEPSSPWPALGVLGGAALGAIVLIPVDDSFRGWFQSTGMQDNSLIGWTAAGAREFGGYGPYALAAVAWGGGAIVGHHATSDMGKHVLFSLGLGQGISWLGKGISGRLRPYVPPNEPERFDLGRGFDGDSDSRSFPSGHTMSAFALATSLSEEMGHHWPEFGRYASPVLYGVAGLTALSRVYHDKHWMSDVLVGAALGIAVGRVVPMLAHRPDGSVGGVAFHPTVGRGARGELTLGGRIQWAHP